MSEVKQVIVLRKDLHMRAGKSCAQAAHASLKVILDMMAFEDVSVTNPPSNNPRFVKLSMIISKSSPIYDWLSGHFTKIVLYVNSEEELRDLYNKAEAKGLPCAFIVDSGFTEFHGNKTATCIAIGPDYSDKIDDITGDLPLL